MLYFVFFVCFFVGCLVCLVMVVLFGVVLLNGVCVDIVLLKVGILISLQIEVLKIVVKEVKEQGFDVKIVEFIDWNMLNVVFVNKDIDVNYFQYILFFENVKKQGGYNFILIVFGMIMKIGFYLKKVKSFVELKDGVCVVIVNDLVNGGCGLLLLQCVGFIMLKLGVDYCVIMYDIVVNLKYLKIILFEVLQFVCLFDDVDFVQGYLSFIKFVGMIDLNSVLLFDGIENKNFVIQWVVWFESVNDLCICKFIVIYQYLLVVCCVFDNVFGLLYVIVW